LICLPKEKAHGCPETKKIKEQNSNATAFPQSDSGSIAAMC